MRKLDELLQDIPLGLLLPDSDVKEEKEEAPRRCIARSSEEAPAALRSGLPVGAAAALIAAAAAIVLAVSVKMNHSVGTEPAGQPETSGAETITSAAGSISSSEAESGLDYENRVVMQVSTENNGVMLKYADISELPWLTEWYEGFLACDPEPVKGLDGDPLTVHSILRIDDGGVSIFFNYAGEIVTVTTSKADNANMTVNGRHYKWDASVFDRVKDYMAQ